MRRKLPDTNSSSINWAKEYTVSPDGEVVTYERNPLLSRNTTRSDFIRFLIQAVRQTDPGIVKNAENSVYFSYGFWFHQMDAYAAIFTHVTLNDIDGALQAIGKPSTPVNRTHGLDLMMEEVGTFETVRLHVFSLLRTVDPKKTILAPDRPPLPKSPSAPDDLSYFSSSKNSSSGSYSQLFQDMIERRRLLHSDPAEATRESKLIK